MQNKSLRKNRRLLRLIHLFRKKLEDQNEISCDIFEAPSGRELSPKVTEGECVQRKYVAVEVR